MEFQSFEAEYNGWHFVIKEDLPDVGAYIYVFEKGRDICTYDYLQDDIEACKKQALEDFGVPLDSWWQNDYAEIIIRPSWYSKPKKRTIKIVGCIACYMLGYAMIWEGDQGSLESFAGIVLTFGIGSFLLISIRRDSKR